MKHIPFPEKLSVWLAAAYLSVFLCFTLTADAQQANCNYPVKELSEICRQYDSSNIIIHENVPETGLNDLVSSWTEPGKLHLLPAQHYQLSQPLELRSGQAILPISAPLNETAPAMISLSLGADFSWAGYDHFTVLVLNRGNRAGWVSINGNQIHSHAPAQNDATTLVTINSTDVQLSASQLNGDSGGRFRQLVAINSQEHSGSGQVLLSRNQLTSSDSPVLVHCALGNNQTLILKNNMIAVTNTTGIRSVSGLVQAEHNDFLLNQKGYCNNCSALALGHADAFTINNNMFWRSVSSNLDLTALSLNASAATGNQGFIVANNICPGIALTKIAQEEFNHGYFSDAYQVLGNNYANALGRPYPLRDPGKFFAFTGNLGNTLVPTVLLPDIGQYISVKNNVSDLSALQQSATINPMGFTDLSLLTAAQHPVDTCTADCRFTQSGFSPGGMIGFLVTSGVSFITTVATFAICYKFGKTRRRAISPYTQVLNDQD